MNFPIEDHKMWNYSIWNILNLGVSLENGIEYILKTVKWHTLQVVIYHDCNYNIMHKQLSHFSCGLVAIWCNLVTFWSHFWWLWFHSHVQRYLYGIFRNMIQCMVLEVKNPKPFIKIMIIVKCRKHDYHEGKWVILCPNTIYWGLLGYTNWMIWIIFVIFLE